MYLMIKYIKYMQIFFFINIVGSNNETSESNEALVLYSVTHKQIYWNGIYLSKFEDFLSNRYNESFKIDNSKVIASNARIFQINYDIEENLVLWSTIATDKYLSFSLYLTTLYENKFESNNSLSINLLSVNSTQLLFSYKTSQIYLFTYDWIHNLIYYIYLYSISVLHINQRNNSYIIVTSDFTIKSISVEPKESLIFWSECSNVENQIDTNCRIIKANQDGSQRITVRDFEKGFVYELTIDSIKRQLFWFDKQNESIKSIDFDGYNSRIVFKLSKVHLDRNIGGFDLFNGSIYFYCNENNSTDRKMCTIDASAQNTSIAKVNDISDKHLVIESEFRIIHSYEEPKAINRCFNAKCTHLCLPLNQSYYRCVCPLYEKTTTCRQKTREINSTEIEDFVENESKSSNLILIISIMVSISLLIVVTICAINQLIVKKRHKKINSLENRKGETLPDFGNNYDDVYNGEVYEIIDYSQVESNYEYIDEHQINNYMQILPTTD